MAKRITEILVDDLDGTELEPGDGSTVRFGLDGVSYEIDLNAAHAQELRDALAPYIRAGRKATGSTRAARAASTRAASPDLRGVRAWLREHGHEVSDRGRIPAHLIEFYDAAHTR